MKIKDWLLILLILTTISACKMDMNTEIYVRDIEEVALKNAKDLHTSGQLRVGVPNCEDKDQLDQVSNLLMDYFINLKAKSCDGEMESFVTMGIDVPIVTSETGWTRKTKSITALVTHKSKDGSNIVVNFALNRNRFSNHNEAVEKSVF